MIRRPPRSTLDRSSAASDVYKRQGHEIRIMTAEVVIDNLDLRQMLHPIGAEIPRHDQFEGVTAVSYTHLRAHETVLDLVCRLLLEKKKQVNPNMLYTI